MAPLTVFLDANVLYPAALRDLFMRLALQGLFRAKRSDIMKINRYLTHSTRPWQCLNFLPLLQGQGLFLMRPSLFLNV